MSNVPYVIHIGGNLYLDGSGKIIQGSPPPNSPVYEPPFTLPIDPKMVVGALKDVKDVLEDINKNKNKYHEKFVKIFNTLSIPLDLLDVLNIIGKGAAFLTVVGSVVSVAFDLAKLFGLLNEGPSKLEFLIENLKTDLQEAAYSNQDTTRLLLVQAYNSSPTFARFGNDYANNLKKTNPNIMQLELDRNANITAHKIHFDKITVLLSPTTWLSMFNQDEHTNVFGQLLGILYTMPGGPDSAPMEMIMPKQNSNYFDHRLMVAMVAKVIEEYLIGIRGLSLEYRTTGDYCSNIRILANGVSELAKLMRATVLTRTIYEPKHFFGVVLNEDEVIFDSYDWISGTYKGLKVSPYCRRWPVGALDLRNHNNSYFKNFSISYGRYIPSDEIKNFSYNPIEGLMNAQWTPPAILEELPSTPGINSSSKLFIIKNPEDCAEAANVQSESDYAKLVAASGYFELLHLEALLRHESTEPDQSQTVHCKNPVLWRTPLQVSNVTVESRNILGTGIIKTNAVRENQEFSAISSIRTQSIKRARPVQYKIKLRTLNSIYSSHWIDPEYTQFQWAQYEPDLPKENSNSTNPEYTQIEQDPSKENKNFKKLVLKQSDADLDESTLISKWTSSPRDESIYLQGTAELTADTFDWWIPVKSKSISPFSTTKDIEFSKKRLTSSAILSSGVNVTPPNFSGKPGAQDWQGEKRDLKKQKVKIEYTLEWTEDKLTVSIKNNPEHRNFVVFLVVEELLIDSGQVLHTAVPIPINGLLTYVPQKFFDDEAKALAKAVQIIIKYSKRYSVEKIPNPLDPITGWLRPDDFMINIDSINRFVEFAEKNDSELLKEIVSSFKDNH
ncbi:MULTISPECIES: hypothetical protein [Bacillus cereus group]|uniref:hypothetical protein n=1 Tax=Bacillus cereus group TaxID=86661 RepID=UPI000BEF59A2|nr:MULTISPECIES: hypothetical protein [Bacillus cereus group]PEL72607.1 hypothetical protein CN603_23730 [Bacillus toyonensis]